MRDRGEQPDLGQRQTARARCGRAQRDTGGFAAGEKSGDAAGESGGITHVEDPVALDETKAVLRTDAEACKFH